ncbi:zinc transporter ZupT [Wielerella bovis]|uniref:zinc transporter ZupT n=1 Tax=Wielerella bovis TaxID=2917790 RepID=UPI002019CEEF|nr:zinc transporter ZupT [Wielerella bovis]ULJ60930.1 zinc transporter ZupT [Wielerella bovis]ULJ63058.1 zinc transporter ZupT [Wielerella bovis]ULJ65289.1 zinc transporter ZupT [Wielerella bovis]ULJ67636.1 zinc transporter ZupT [Wielerella bovis]
MSSHLFIAFGITFAAGLATVLGSALVLFCKTPNPRILSFGLAFAGGAMVYVSLTEILNKSIEAFSVSLGDKWATAAATAAFLFGMGLVLLIDRVIPNPHDSLNPNDPDYEQKSRDLVARVGFMAAFAITAHNLPEGLATFFATLDNPKVGAPLALAIAVHNIPEGISIAAPVYFATRKKGLTVLMCALSGLAEPLGAILGYTILRPFLSPTMFGAVFGLIAGVMVFLALDELLPAAKRYALGHETVYGLVTGMGVISVSLVLFQF